MVNSKDGEFKRWYKNGIKNGVLRIKKFYKNDLCEDDSFEWYSNGNLMIQKYCVNDIFQGEFKTWHENGKIS